MQSALRPAGTACAACRPSSSTQTTSPGRTSRTTSAPMRSSAHVSDATTQSSPICPSESGRKPSGSRNATSVSSTSAVTEYAPSSRRHRRCDGLDERRRIARDQRRDDLGVRAGCEPDAVGDELARGAPRRSRGCRCARARSCARARDGSAAGRSTTCSRRSSSSACARSRPRPAAPGAAARRRRGRRGPSRGARSSRPPSETAMPADSCPRCWSANSPKYARRATSRSGERIPKTPHISRCPPMRFASAGAPLPAGYPHRPSR